MKLSNLFMIALLAGTLGVFGCSDDNGGAAGTGGGTGGSGGADPCTGDFCEDSNQPNKGFCEELIALCNNEPELDFTTAECEAFGKQLCPLDPSGTGGTGGGGGTGGTGGGGGTGGTGGGGGTGGTPSGGNCDYGECLNEPNKSTCETLVGYCEATLGLFPELLEYCIEGTNLDQCGDPQL